MRISKWYSDETTKFVTKYNIDKLDDIGDTILMIKSFLSNEKMDEAEEEYILKK